MVIASLCFPDFGKQVYDFPITHNFPATASVAGQSQFMITLPDCPESITLNAESN